MAPLASRDDTPRADARNTRFYFRKIDDVLLVLDLVSAKFTLLNRTAGAVWLCLLDEDWKRTDLIGFLQRSFSGPVAPSDADLRTLLGTWEKLGWLSETGAGTVQIPSGTNISLPPPFKRITAATFQAAVSGAVPEWTRKMDFLGRAVTVRFYCDPGMAQSDVVIRAQAFLRGVPPANFDDEPSIDCFVTRGGIFLRHGDLYIEAEDVSDGLSRLVLWCFYKAYGRDGFLGTMHAAALGCDAGAIILPGVSGMGKSTLTAYLAHNGWRYGGDDIIGLSRSVSPAGGVDVLPFCSSVSVKEGSLQVLAPFYPELEELPLVHYETKVARFPNVPIANQMIADSGTRLVRAIVFPAYAETAHTSLTPLSTEEALLSLVGVGFRAGETADPARFDSMFSFLETTPKYRLDFSSLNEAQQELETLL